MQVSGSTVAAVAAAVRRRSISNKSQSLTAVSVEGGREDTGRAGEAVVVVSRV